MEGTILNLIRRIGPDPHLDDEGGPQQTPFASGCPDLWEVENGDILIIGRKVALPELGSLPKGVSCGDDEQAILFPRAQLIRASTAISSLE